MEKLRFAELGVSEEILKAVDKMGFEEASPIQTAVIPIALTGKDIVGQSSTGSGKTAAFAIPAIERCDARDKRVQVLILCPTRELALQVAEEIAKLALFKKGLNAMPIYGGQSYERQFRALDAGTQIIIGTPGRIMDHMQRGSLRLDALKVAILDEADRMLDMGFRDDIETILSATPATRQLLFFSATMPRPIQDLIGRYSKDPEWIMIEGLAQDAPQVDQVFFEVDRRSKLEALTRVIDLHDFRYGIIFCSTKVMVDDLDDHLHARGYSVDRLHGDISQAQRDRVMEKFRHRGFEFLVATDVAARGLDVNDLEVVFNFDLPNDAEDYTHRIGRTGRAGRSGHAFTFVSGREIYKLQGMIRFARLNITRGQIPSIDQIEEARENVFFEKIRTTLDKGDFKKEDRMIDRLLEQGYSSTDIAAALLSIMQGQNPAAETAKTAATPAAPAGAPAPKTPRKEAPAWVPSSKVKKAAAAARPVAAPAPQPETPRVSPEPVPTPAVETTDTAAPAVTSASSPEEPVKVVPPKRKFERQGRTGREEGMTTLYFNVGRRQLISTGDLVGKIAGVTSLPGEVVGAIDLHQRHALVDVATEHSEFILKKLHGVRLRGQVLKPLLATQADFDKPDDGGPETPQAS
jgi:ATP-dependent RNA helicase DeaD